MYELLEARLAEFFGAEAAGAGCQRLHAEFDGYPGAVGQFSHALIDERAHGCLFDAAQLLDARSSGSNIAILMISQKSCGARQSQPLVLTDACFRTMAAPPRSKNIWRICPRGVVCSMTRMARAFLAAPGAARRNMLVLRRPDHSNDHPQQGIWRLWRGGAGSART